jgi:hypothetical protein
MVMSDNDEQVILINLKEKIYIVVQSNQLLMPLMTLSINKKFTSAKINIQQLV